MSSFDRFLGSGQKLLARLFDEHPCVTVKQPSNYIRHVSLFSEAWFEEESLETNQLNEEGISKEVLLDTLQVRSKLYMYISNMSPFQVKNPLAALPMVELFQLETLHELLHEIIFYCKS